jgi:hypothetical protein
MEYENVRIIIKIKSAEGNKLAHMVESRYCD